LDGFENARKVTSVRSVKNTNEDTFGSIPGDKVQGQGYLERISIIDMGGVMKELCLLAVVVASIAGCASTPMGEISKGERVADAYVPVGTMIPRKKVEHGAAPASVVDKQAMENERAMGARTLNGR
jgi:hypothetical protein